PTDPGSCNDCFETEIVEVERMDGCTTYTMEVSHNGQCRYALSHLTVELPCGDVSNIRNSEGWKMEFVNPDPTTGLSGLKIDDISGFGEKGGSETFTVSFTVCQEKETCGVDFACWEPVVAYKSGRCVDFDTLTQICTPESSIQSQGFTAAPVYSVYPNPMIDVATIEFEVLHSSNVTIQLYSMTGVDMGVLYNGFVNEGTLLKVPVHANDLPNDIYIYKISSGSGVFYGKLFITH